MHSPIHFDTVQETLIADHRLLQQTALTLDDLNVYAGPIATVVNLMTRAGNGAVLTDQQILVAFRSAVAESKKIDARITARDSRMERNRKRKALAA